MLPSFTSSDFTTSSEKQWFLGTFIALKNEWNQIKAEQKLSTVTQFFTKWNLDHALFISTFYPGVYQQILKDNPYTQYYPQSHDSQWHSIMEQNPDFHKRFQCWSNGEP
jgi:hypothetical protein